MKEVLYDNEQFHCNFVEYRACVNSYSNLIEQPTILRLIGDIAGKKVLDVGCGYGALSIKLSKLNAQRILGIDVSDRMLRMGKEINSAPNIEYRLLDASDIDKIDEKFDLVCSSFAFHYIEDFPAFIKKVSNLLDTGKQFIFSQAHPISTAGEMGAVITDLNEGVSIKNYSIEGISKTEWLGKIITRYHRKISTIINTLIANGFIINEMIEPAPTEDLILKNKAFLTELQRPRCLLIKATKG